jgi:ribosomal-protein-alanine N-acetyltransferase
MGFIIYDLIYERCELEYIGVLKEYRKNNIASELMEYMINDTFNNNIDNISLEVDIYNIGAIKLYEKYNFQKKAIRKNYYNNHDAYLMVRVV